MSAKRTGRFAVGLISFVLAGHAATGAACGLHGTMPDLAVAHPRSIDVALAVHDATERDGLKPLAALPPGLAFLRARRTLISFEPQVADFAGRAGGPVAVLLVESGLWTRYTFAAGRAIALPHVAGPMPGEHVIVTSETVLAAILDGTLEPARARQLGLFVQG